MDENEKPSPVPQSSRPWVDRQERELLVVAEVWAEWLSGRDDLPSAQRLRPVLASRMATWRDPSSVQAGVSDVLSPYSGEWQAQGLSPSALASLLSDRLVGAGRMVAGK